MSLGQGSQARSPLVGAGGSGPLGQTLRDPISNPGLPWHRAEPPAWPRGQGRLAGLSPPLRGRHVWVGCREAPDHAHACFPRGERSETAGGTRSRGRHVPAAHPQRAGPSPELSVDRGPCLVGDDGRETGNVVPYLVS